jgi:hypothetical protein
MSTGFWMAFGLGALASAAVVAPLTWWLRGKIRRSVA